MSCPEWPPQHRRLVLDGCHARQVSPVLDCRDPSGSSSRQVGRRGAASGPHCLILSKAAALDETTLREESRSHNWMRVTRVRMRQDRYVMWLRKLTRTIPSGFGSYHKGRAVLRRATRLAAGDDLDFVAIGVLEVGGVMVLAPRVRVQVGEHQLPAVQQGLGD